MSAFGFNSTPLKPQLAADTLDHRLTFSQSDIAPQQVHPGWDNDPILAMVGMQSGFGRIKEVVVQYEKSTTPAPAWLDASKDKNEIEEKITKILDERMEVQFNNLSLGTIAKLIRGKFDIPVWIDEKSLEDENITPDEPVTLERPPTKLRDVLKQVLNPLQLTYVVELEGITITSKQSQANVVRYYDLSYVFPDSGLIAELFHAIETVVTPNQWQSAGGASSMCTVGSMLLVTAPHDSQEAIENLLRAISKQTFANMKSRFVVEKDPAKPLDLKPLDIEKK